MGRGSQCSSVSSFAQRLLTVAVAGTFGLFTACGGGSGSGSKTPPTVNVVVTPSTANVVVGQTQTFKASVFGSSNAAVTWSVTESGGGTVDSSGNYTAPMAAGTYHVVATSVANPADSGSAPAVVTVPQPAFTSSPSTTAAQDQPYTYTLAATDPAGTAITYTLTSAPVGAVLSGGNTVTWTPTAQQARQNNGFAVTATTAAGGTATQSWTVAPTGTIQGSIFIEHWSADGSVGIENNPVDKNYSWAALIPQSDGSLNVLPGTGYPDATFTIPNVPAGYYWLQFSPGDVVWTNASNLDYGADAIGHKQLPLTLQVIGCDITGMDPFDPANHQLILYSINAQAFELGMEDLNPGDPPPAPYPTTGSTTCNANPTVSFTGGDFSAIEGISGISPSMGDVSTVSQFEAAPADTLAAPFDSDAMIGPAVNESLDIEGNYPFPFPTFIVPGALTNTNPQSQDFNVTFSSWANAFNASGPGAAIPQAFLIFLSAQQQAAALARPYPNYSGASPNLVAAMALPSSAWPKDASGNNVWPQDGDLGSMTYNNPFLNQTNPSFANIYEMYADAQYTIPLPGSATPMQPILEDFVWTPNAAGFTPGVQPVGNPQINGTTLFTATTVPTVTPTLTWDAPTADGSVVYDIMICAPTTSADCQPPSRLSTQQTGFVYQFSQYSQTSFTVPAGILTPGTNYVFFIVAELRTGYDPLHPQRFSLPWGAAWTVSNVVTVSGSAAAGVVHGNQALISKKPGPLHLFGSQMHVNTKRPTFSGVDSRYVLPAPEPSVAPYPHPTTQK